MKSELTDANSKLEYPYLGFNAETGLVILLTDHNWGTVVHSGKSQMVVGYHSDRWTWKFTKFDGHVTLSN